MKKILDKYKIPGYERQITYYAIKRSNIAENNVQLEADLENFIPSKKQDKLVEKHKRRRRDKISPLETTQLSLELN